MEASSGTLTWFVSKSFNSSMRTSSSSSHRFSSLLPRVIGVLFGLSVLSLVQSAHAQDKTSPTKSETPEPETPKIAAASDEGEKALASFRKPEGWISQLVAAEPELANPVAFFIDHSGRIFVCESFRQGVGVTDNRSHDEKWLQADLAAMTVEDRIRFHRELLGDKAIEYELKDDRIRLLKDNDGDGKYETSLVFADHFNRIEDGTGAGVLVRGNDAYYTCIPKLWKLSDDNNDGVADRREVLYDGFGVRVAFRGHDMHGLIIGPDGRLYFSIGDRGFHVQTKNGLLANPECGAVFRCELDGSNLELYAVGLRNPQELAFDDHGNLFTGDNNSDSGDKARWVYVARGGDSGWRMFYQYLPDRGPFNRDQLWQPYQPSTPAYIVPPIINFGDGPSGLTSYPGTGLGDEYKNTFFLCDFRGGPANSGIRTIRLERDGAFFKVVDDAQPIWQILATDVDFGPDGYIYVSDWVNGWNGEGKGRIYRFGDPKQLDSTLVKQTMVLLREGMKDRAIETLSTLLSHPDRRVRQEAQLEIAARGELNAFIKVLASSQDRLPKLHAIWGLGQFSRQSPVIKSQAEDSTKAVTALANALSDSDIEILCSTLDAIADSTPSAVADSVKAKIVALVSHEDAAVRYHAALASGLLNIESAFEPVLKMLMANANAAGNDTDPMLRHGGIMALKGIADSSKLAALKSHPSKSVRLAAVVALRKQLSAEVAQFIADYDAVVATEAARAINDEPALHAGAMEALANALSGGPKSFAFEHRALNAAFRLGRNRDVEGIVAYAADPSRDESLRLEALDMLALWSKPGLNDRVMNRYLPLTPGRSSEAVVATLRQSLPKLVASSEKIRQTTLKVAADLGITEVVPLLTQVVTSEDGSPIAKAQALEALVGLEGDKALSLIQPRLNDNSVEVRSVALKLLAKLRPDEAIKPLAERVQSTDRTERQLAWDTVAALPGDKGKAILTLGAQAIVDGKLPQDSWLNVIEGSVGKLDDAVAKSLGEFRDKLAAEDKLGSYLHVLEGGDASAGEVLFYTRSELSCVRCHKIGSKGGEVGPVLTGIAKQKDRRYLLEAVVLPDATIAQNFETAIVLTEDDEIFTGIVKSESDSELVLVLADGKNVTIPVDSITDRRKGKSSMPLDLYKYLSDRELRDLVAFLASLDGNQPVEKIESGHGL